MIVLASSSPARMALLAHAGVSFEAVSPGVDEREIEVLLRAGGAAAGDLAIALADAKALAVMALRPDDIVIGADQVLECDGDFLGKPGTRAAAAAQLRRLRGRTHSLHSAVSIARADVVVRRHLSTAQMTMRWLDDDRIERYLDEAGEAALHSAGAYLVEGIGIQLFSAIDGDYFAILGLPMLPLLDALRDLGALES